MALLNKNLSKDGHDRKDRIVDRIFHQGKLSKMIMGLYSSVLPLLKSFVLLFEMKEPLIHQLHEEQVRLFKDFIGCCVKPEVITSATSLVKLKDLDIKSSEKLQNSAAKDHIVKSFLKQVELACVACGKTLQDKLPINNKFLKSVAAI